MRAEQWLWCYRCQSLQRHRERHRGWLMVCECGTERQMPSLFPRGLS